MKILYGITKSNFGGAQRYVFDMALEARKRGHKVAVLVGGDGVLTDKLRSEDIEIMPIAGLGRDISPLDDVRSFFAILSALHKFEPDVFHINSSKMGGIGGLAARIMRVPHIIFTGHGWAFNELRPEWQKVVIKFLYWLTIVLSHKTICVSDGAKRAVAGWLFVKNKLKVIRNGIEAFELLPREKASKELGLENNILIIGTIAELHHIKGLDVLLIAWSELVEKTPAKLVIIGGGEERENLENMAQQLDISDSVIFKGYIDNARRYLSVFDIFVLPSRSEALPYAPLEAGLARLPVVATIVGGVPEIVESGTNGILVFKEDPRSLFSALRELANDKKLRERLGLNLQSTIKQKFSKKRMFEETFKIYQ